MEWSKIKLILAREIRDQLRDRRTLFMILVLPLLLYPLLGMSFFQLAQFLREHATKVLVVGGAELQSLDAGNGPRWPKLLESDAFNPELFQDEHVRLLELEFAGDRPGGELDWAAASEAERTADAQRLLRQREYEAIVYFPPDFANRLAEFRHRLREGEVAEGDVLAVPSPKVFYNTASEKSQITYARVTHVLTRWTEAIGKQNLRESRVPVVAARPFELESSDVAASSHRDAALWSKMLPFVLFIWALTGAFYPAIDLCAGEKERGTLETLLSSPAGRSEIVCGKLVTVMLFSMATATLHLLSMGMTGGLVLSQLNSLNLNSTAGLSLPPPSAYLWLLAALVPISALFSALCLALAAFARSTKEGQYYLMPLVMITMPLMILPMTPGFELTLGNSLIPVAGLVLLMRAVLEGNYVQALPYVAPVVGVTLLCCLLAIRWAVDQFNRESVLFCESERFGLGLWVRHLVRDRGATPNAAEAVVCFVLILLVQFFVNLLITPPEPGNFWRLAELIFISLVVVIATPALMMTIMLTRRPLATLLLDRPPKLLAIPAAILLAVALHPTAQTLSRLIGSLYPKGPGWEALERMMESMQFAPHPALPFLLIAVLPAVCEELAFRGFILSGLRHTGRKWWAIGLSSVFFGMAHGVLQQSLVAAALGLVLGYLAVQTGSLIPCILFHMVHNGLALLTAKFAEWLPADAYANYPQLAWLIERADVEGQVTYVYGWPLIAAGLLLCVPLFVWLRRIPYQRTREEQVQEAIDRSSAGSLA